MGHLLVNVTVSCEGTFREIRQPVQSGYAEANTSTPGPVGPSFTMEGTAMDAHADDLPLGLDENGADDDFSLTCPACGADLVHDELFLRYRVCEDCGRHFSLPARERVGVLVDEGSFQPIR